MDHSNYQNSMEKEMWKNNSSLYLEKLCNVFQNDTKKSYGCEGSLLSKNKNKTFEHRRVSSLPLTEVTVNLIEKTIVNEKRLGKLDVNYASFILHQACLSPTSVILAMIYLDRVKKFNPECLSKMTSSELFLASLVVASKFLFDKGGDEMVYNDEWASFANIDLCDLNKLERDFLEALRWSCFVHPETFMEQVIKIEGLISMNEYLKRKPNSSNSMTYLEMISYFKYIKHFHKDKGQLVWANIKDIIQSILICSVAYFIAMTIVVFSFSLVFTLQSRMTKISSLQQENQQREPKTMPTNDLIGKNIQNVLWTSNVSFEPTNIIFSLNEVEEYFLRSSKMVKLSSHNRTMLKQQKTQRNVGTLSKPKIKTQQENAAFHYQHLFYYHNLRSKEMVKC